jgi:carotenoid cleavage dioxygenase-like enzyme
VWRNLRANKTRKMNRKRINDINTYHFFEGDVTIVGVDENGEDFSLSIDAYELINWIKTDQVREELAQFLLKNKDGYKYKNASQDVIVNSIFKNKENE